MNTLLRRLGRWLCRHDLDPVRFYFQLKVAQGLFANEPDAVANARAYLRILDGHDPADTTET